MAVSMLGLVVIVSVLYAVLLVVYRLYISPLSKFPGKKPAIATMWYEFYYQVIKGGQYPWVIQKMHEEYGRTRSPKGVGNVLSREKDQL